MRDASRSTRRDMPDLEAVQRLEEETERRKQQKRPPSHPKVALDVENVFTDSSGTVRGVSPSDGQSILENSMTRRSASTVRRQSPSWIDRRAVPPAVVLGDTSFDREPPGAAGQTDGRPIQVAEEGYVSSETCRACHPAQYASWHTSFHRSMTQVATADRSGPIQRHSGRRRGRKAHVAAAAGRRVLGGVRRSGPNRSAGAPLASLVKS